MAYWVHMFFSFAFDAKSKKVISFRITRGNVHDAKKFCPLVRESSKKYNIDRVCADKAQDNRRNFNLLVIYA